MCLHSQHDISCSKCRHSFSLMVLFLVLWCSFAWFSSLYTLMLVTSHCVWFGLTSLSLSLSSPPWDFCLCFLNLLFLVCLSPVAYLHQFVACSCSWCAFLVFLLFLLLFAGLLILPRPFWISLHFRTDTLVLTLACLNELLLDKTFYWTSLLATSLSFLFLTQQTDRDRGKQTGLNTQGGAD